MKSPPSNLLRRAGFSLVEVILALLLVGVLSAILLPVFSYTFRESASYTDELAAKYQLRSAMDELSAQSHPAIYLTLDEENAFDEDYRAFIENEVVFSDAIFQNEHSLATRWMAFTENPSGDQTLVSASPPPFAVLEIDLQFAGQSLTTWFFNPQPEEDE
ncbi:MAG: type II secretion system protein [Opitutales bacterium]|nr:type II secretion system protein [Opitutales bacterium]MCH8539722.1 type II secretion system GspH family protein [Opitutales bacterium]